MKKILYRIKIEHIKCKSMLNEEAFDYIHTVIDDGTCEHSSKTDNAKDAVKFIKENLRFVYNPKKDGGMKSGKKERKSS